MFSLISILFTGDSTMEEIKKMNPKYFWYASYECNFTPLQTNFYIILKQSRVQKQNECGGQI